jgi:hypothetical protein
MTRCGYDTSDAQQALRADLESRWRGILGGSRAALGRFAHHEYFRLHHVRARSVHQHPEFSSVLCSASHSPVTRTRVSFRIGFSVCWLAVVGSLLFYVSSRPHSSSRGARCRGVRHRRHSLVLHHDGLWFVSRTPQRRTQCGLTRRCSEHGVSAVVAVHASRGPGR